MKKFLALLGLAVLSASVSAQATNAVSLTDAQIRAIAIANVNIQTSSTGKSATTLNTTSRPAPSKMGTMAKAVTKDEGASIWVTQNMNLMIQQQKVEIQINKADGKVLKTIVNGQEQNTPMIRPRSSPRTTPT